MPQSTYEEYLKTATKQAGLVFSARVIGYILGFAMQVIFARLLGPDQYGLYSLGLTIANVGVLFAVFGLNSGMTRFLGEYLGKKEYGKAKRIIIVGIESTTILSVLTAIFLFIFRWPIAVSIFKDERLVSIIPWFSLVMILLSLMSLLNGIFQGLKKPSLFTFSREVIEKILRIALFIVLYFLGFRVLGVILATLISSLVVLGFLVHSLFKNTKRIFAETHSEKIDVKRLFGYSSNMLFVFFTYFLMGQVNRLILGIYLDSKSVGLYTIAGTVAGLSTFFLTSFNSIFAPMIAELYHKGDLKTLNNMYSNLTRWIVSLTIPITLWLIIFSEDILTIFGKEYILAKYTLIFLAIGQFVNAAVGSNGLILAMTKYQKFEMINGLTVAGLNIFLNILLIPRFGVVGSAIGGMVAISTVNILKSFEVYWILKMSPYNMRYIKPALALVITCFSLVLLKVFVHGIMATIVGLILGFVVMLGSLWILGPYKEDRIIVDSILRKLRKTQRK